MSRAVALDLAADRLDQVSRSEGENRDWRKLARDKQKPPDGDDWQIWLLMAGRGFGKMLDVETPVPTPVGWTAMGKLHVDDQVFDENGVVCRVVDTTDIVTTENAWRVRFSDGSWIDACGDHLWVTMDALARKHWNRSVKQPDWSGWAAKTPTTTDQIRGSLRYGKRADRNHGIPTTQPLDLPEAELPIDPWLLGYWLGNGTAREGVLSCHADHVGALVYKLRDLGYETTTRADTDNGRMVTTYKLFRQLRTIGLLNNKHVPRAYLRGSIGQRLELLRGLMDSDGDQSRKNNGMVEFTNTNKDLADAVRELTCSLGWQVRLDSRVGKTGGREYKRSYRVRFTPDQPVFTLGRRQTERTSQLSRSRIRMITAIEPIPPTPMRCISVDSPNKMYLAGRAMVPTHNTWTGANWIIEQALSQPDSEWAVIAPTFRDVRKTCIEESSGILSMLQPGELVRYRRNELQISLSNGSTIYGYSADQPERIRGANLHGAWCEELGSWRYEETWHEGLIPALRKGINPRVVVTTTPRPTKLIKHLTKRDDGSVYITRGSTWENREHLSEAALRGLQARYGGTRLGRQELEGELLEDIEGALWTRSVLDETRLRHRDEAPDLVRIVVGVDPAVTSKPGSDEHGIVVCGMDAEGHGYVLGDFSLQGTPNTAVRRAVQAFNAHEADLIVGEVNNGGDFIESLVRTVSADVPYKSVRATRGKLLRAEPVSALYEQKRVHHVGALPELEDQMCDWTPLDLDSPDRLDAMVWAMTEMFQLGGDTWSGMYGHRNCTNCERGYMPIEGRTKCPHCGHPIAEVA